MTDIFISYFHNDRSKAEALARALEAVGWSVWWDRTIPAGGMFDQVIEEALADAKVVIVLWSRRSVQSRWVLNEAEEAAARNILVPALIELDVRIPLAFKRIQAADLVEWDGRDTAPSFRELSEDILQRLGPPKTSGDAEAEEKRRREAAAAAAEAEEKRRQEDAAAARRDAEEKEKRRQEEAAEAARLEAARLAEEERRRRARLGVESGSGAWATPAKSPQREWPWLLRGRAGLTSLLAAVFFVNYVETMVETMLRRGYGVGSALGNRIAYAFHGLEGGLTFESHDVTNWLAVYGYSISYFFVLPLLGIGLIIALWRRKEIEAYRVLCLAIVVDYLISLGFFVFFPVPERWAYPDSGAMLLSDRWSSNLIESLRPISGLDNCFPSSHVSLTVVIILVGYLCRVRLRNTILALGVTVILSTFVLGIHWIPDILAGLAAGFLSVAIAQYLAPMGTPSIAQWPSEKDQASRGGRRTAASALLAKSP